VTGLTTGVGGHHAAGGAPCGGRRATGGGSGGSGGRCHLGLQNTTNLAAPVNN